MPYKNIEDRRAASRRHYEVNTQAIKERAFAFKKQQRLEILRMLRGLKENTACADCTASYPAYVMQFDHVRGEKLFNLGDFGRGNRISMKRVRDEVAKCEIVCANCHAERTHQRGQRFGLDRELLAAVDGPES